MHPSTTDDPLERRRAPARMTLTIAALLVTVVGTAQVTPSRPSTAPRTPAARLVTSACVLNAGSASGRRDSHGHTSGSCSLGAECVRHPGHAAAGDGFVNLACEETSCTCEWTSATSRRTLRTRFVIDAPCTDSDTSRRLFMDHCMVGLHLYTSDGGAR